LSDFLQEDQKISRKYDKKFIIFCIFVFFDYTSAVVLLSNIKKIMTFPQDQQNPQVQEQNPQVSQASAEVTPVVANQNDSQGGNFFGKMF
jgi:hypothetical protein